MKEIKSINVWFNGNNVLANRLMLTLNSGILGESAIFAYAIYKFENDELSNQLISGLLTMDGDEYKKWGSDDEYVWEWAADKLKLELIK